VGFYKEQELADKILVPKFKKQQIIRIAPYNEKGKPKNDFARTALPYFSQTAEVLSVNLYEKSDKALLVYRVKTEDGTVLPLTEDCLMTVNDGR
jgi:hypothetical protein